MSRLNWSRAATASKRWAYGTSSYAARPKTLLARAREAVAICQADYDQARASLKPIKLRRLLAAKTQLALAYRKQPTLQ